MLRENRCLLLVLNLTSSLSSSYQSRNVAHLVGDTLNSGAHLVGDTLHSGAHLVGDNLNTGVNLVGGTLNTGVNLVGGTLNPGAHLVGDGLRSGAQFVHIGVDGVARTISGVGVESRVSQRHFEKDNEMQIFCSDMYTSNFIKDEILRCKQNIRVSNLLLEDLIVRDEEADLRAARKLVRATSIAPPKPDSDDDTEDE